MPPPYRTAAAPLTDPPPIPPAHPLVALAKSLHEDGRPSLAWLIEHAPDGRIDPALWTDCTDAYAMMMVVSQLFRSESDAIALTQSLLDAGVRPGAFAWTPWELHRAWTNPKLCDVIRSVVPELPPVQELIERRRGR